MRLERSRPAQNLDAAAIREGGEVVSARPERFAARFYETLFIADPEVRRLFHVDPDEQGRKFVATLAIVLDSIEDWERLRPLLAGLARRHVAYGVTPAHYGAVAAALLSTLASHGATARQLSAWEAAIGVIAGEMIAAAYPLPHPPPIASQSLATTAGDRRKDG